MEIIDTHCHLNAPDFNQDRSAVFKRAADAGVVGFIMVATEPNDWRRSLDLAEAYTAARVAIGIHPHEASYYTTAIGEDLKALAGNARVAAIGETGLDFFRNRSPRDKQYESFQAHLEIANEIQKPFILHCRAAEAEMLEVLEAFKKKIGRPLCGVWHCFTATSGYASRATALGLHFGLGGIATYPKASDLREVLAGLPEDRLVLETDCPYLPPQGWRGQRNEPAYLSKVVETLATVRKIAPAEVCRITTANARALFKLD